VERGGRRKDEDCSELDRVQQRGTQWTDEEKFNEDEGAENGVGEEKTRTVADMRATCRWRSPFGSPLEPVAVLPPLSVHLLKTASRRLRMPPPARASSAPRPALCASR
jgi:hypothetical protein